MSSFAAPSLARRTDTSCRQQGVSQRQGSAREVHKAHSSTGYKGAEHELMQLRTYLSPHNLSPRALMAGTGAGNVSLGLIGAMRDARQQRLCIEPIIAFSEVCCPCAFDLISPNLLAPEPTLVLDPATDRIPRG